MIDHCNSCECSDVAKAKNRKIRICSYVGILCFLCVFALMIDYLNDKLYEKWGPTRQLVFSLCFGFMVFLYVLTFYFLRSTCLQILVDTYVTLDSLFTWENMFSYVNRIRRLVQTQQLEAPRDDTEIYSEENPPPVPPKKKDILEKARLLDEARTADNKHRTSAPGLPVPKPAVAASQSQYLPHSSMQEMPPAKKHSSGSKTTLKKRSLSEHRTEEKDLPHTAEKIDLPHLEIPLPTLSSNPVQPIQETSFISHAARRQTLGPSNFFPGDHAGSSAISDSAKIKVEQQKRASKAKYLPMKHDGSSYVSDPTKTEAARQTRASNVKWFSSEQAGSSISYPAQSELAKRTESSAKCFPTVQAGSSLISDTAQMEAKRETEDSNIKHAPRKQESREQAPTKGYWPVFAVSKTDRTSTQETKIRDPHKRSEEDVNLPTSSKMCSSLSSTGAIPKTQKREVKKLPIFSNYPSFSSSAGAVGQDIPKTEKRKVTNLPILSTYPAFSFSAGAVRRDVPRAVNLPMLSNYSAFSSSGGAVRQDVPREVNLPILSNYSSSSAGAVGQDIPNTERREVGNVQTSQSYSASSEGAVGQDVPKPAISSSFTLSGGTVVENVFYEQPMEILDVSHIEVTIIPSSEQKAEPDEEQQK